MLLVVVAAVVVVVVVNIVAVSWRPSKVYLQHGSA